MGYYENPPMIEPDRSGFIIAESISDAAKSISQGILTLGERKRKEEEEKKLTVKKLQEYKNKTDLLYNDKLSDWSKTQTGSNPELNQKVYGLINEKLQLAADSQIALLDETDPTKRQQLLANVRMADQFLNNSSEFGKNIAMATATWRESAKAVKVGVPGGYVINGETDEQIEDNTAAIEILGGMNQLYKDANIEVQSDEQGDGVILKVSGKHSNGREFNVMINSKEYMAAETSGDGGLLLNVEKLDDFYADARKNVVDDKGNVYAQYLSQKRETVDLPSKGGDIYQIRNGQRLNDVAIKADINKKSEIRASGILASYKPSNLRTLIDYTLGNGPGFYDKNFKNITDVEEQKKILSSMLTEETFKGMTKSLETTIDANGNKVYWNPTADIALKQKEKVETKPEKEKPYTYKEEYIDRIITGLDPTTTSTEAKIAAYEERTEFVNNLNKMAGGAKFATRDELYNRWKKQPYKSGSYESGNTIEEEYKTGSLKGKSIENAFAKIYPHSNGYVYVEKSANTFVPVKGYNLNKAKDRVKLALDYTAEAGERKMLQGKLRDASLMDWMKENPRKQNESTEAYMARVKKAGF